jgi:TatD DNase family protein
LEVLKDFADLKLYFHCRGYGAKEIGKIEGIFPHVWFGFTNIISYPSAEKTRESAITAKNEHILLETDAPFLPPQVFRGKMNYPTYVKYVYEKCTEILEMEQGKLERQVEENFAALF